MLELVEKSINVQFLAPKEKATRVGGCGGRGFTNRTRVFILSTCRARLYAGFREETPYVLFDKHC